MQFLLKQKQNMLPGILLIKISKIKEKKIAISQYKTD